jgi:hypothetical protein
MTILVDDGTTVMVVGGVHGGALLVVVTITGVLAGVPEHNDSMTTLYCVLAESPVTVSGEAVPKSSITATPVATFVTITP